MDDGEFPRTVPRSEVSGGPDLTNVEKARSALARGDLIAAYDCACAGLASGAPDAAFLMVLSLARMGDTETARRQYRELHLDAATDVDTRSLGARLAKDAADSLSGQARRRQFGAAAAAYAAIYDETGDIFPGVNAASLRLLAGDSDAAGACAAAVLARQSEPTDFWTGASRAEALLLLGRDSEARQEIVRALELPGCNIGARGTTLKQFEKLARLAGCDHTGQVRALLRPPATAFYCGHMFRADDAIERVLTARIDTALEAQSIGIGFGALACGSDILIAERLLARGSELHVVLPFELSEFVAMSVDPGGPGWRPRMDACLAAATSVRTVSDIRNIGDAQSISYSSNIAMGLSRLRASQLGGTSTMLAVWDGAPARGDAGTAVDVARWRSSAGDVTVFEPGAVDRNLAASTQAPLAMPPRRVVAMLFTDVPGFAALDETDIPGFWRDVMGAAAKVLDSHGERVRSRNSWGDAVFAVVDDIAAAADIVLSLHRALESIGTRFTLRIGAHFGPVFETLDPITNRTTYYGREVSRTARIEPVTPSGQVYVTEAFAAALAMADPARFGCHYIGQIALAKNYGTFPMYRLFRVPSL